MSVLCTYFFFVLWPLLTLSKRALVSTEELFEELENAPPLEGLNISLL